MRTKIIAEAGVNHNGEEALAFQLVDAARSAGADIVKFQTFIARKLVTSDAKQCDYQVTNTGREESQLEMLTRLELGFDVYQRLIEYCNKQGIEFLSTAFDSESLEFLVKKLRLTTLKIPSGEITNAPFVLEHARTGCDLIVSTGMATLAEVEAVLGVIAFGYTVDNTVPPSLDAFQNAYFSDAGQKRLKEKVTLLHCTTEYPAPMKDINLRAMDTMTHAFGLPVGYSDHSEGITVPIAAVARGATVIEKHFTLDKAMEGPDHKASIDPAELKAMVCGIRAVEEALGNGIKGPRPSEIANKTIVRKSIVAALPILAGQMFAEGNLEVKRPGHGASPYQYWRLLGQVAKRAYNPGEVIIE
jgi:N-acetylneuraminate synthase